MLTSFLVTLLIFAVFTGIVAVRKKSIMITGAVIVTFAALFGLKMFFEGWFFLINYTNGQLLLNIGLSFIIGTLVMWLFTFEDFSITEIIVSIISVVVVVGIIIFTVVDNSQNQEKYDALEVVKADVNTLNFNEKEVYKVDQDFALNKISKSLSEVPNHAYFEIKTMNLIEMNDELVYVAEIGHKGFFKWKKEKKIPGYFTLSATDMEAKVEFVDFEYNYSEYSYFGNYASRILYKHTKDELVGSIHFELDDQGTPYYIQAIQQNVNFASGVDEKGLSTINLLTGDVKTYSLEEAPKWMEDSIGSDQASYIAEIRGEYPKGSFNFSNEGKTTPNLNGEESGLKPVFIGGKKYYFVEFSTHGNAGDSMDDALLIDARSGVANKIDFEEPLMDSNGAIKIGEKKYVEKEWHGVNPMLYNIDGTPTWIYSLLDSNNYHQKFVFVNAKNHSITEDDGNLTKALTKYKDSVAKGVGSSNIDDTKKLPELNKTIVIKNIEHIETEEGYKFFIKSMDGEKFTYATNVIEELIFHGNGETLSVTFKDTGDIKTIISIDSK